MDIETNVSGESGTKDWLSTATRGAKKSRNVTTSLEKLSSAPHALSAMSMMPF